jgi:phosphate transport system substrate-binding protein
MPSWIWWLLPLGLLALLLGWLFGDRRAEEDPELTAEGGVLPDNDNYSSMAATGLGAGAVAAGGAALDYSRTEDNGIGDLSSLSEGNPDESEGNMFAGLWGNATDAAEGAVDGVGNAARSGGDALSGLFGGASDMAGNVMNAGGSAIAGGAAMAAGAAAAAGSAFSGGAPATTPSTGTNRIVLVPREPHRAHVYWEIPNAYKEAIRQRGGEKLALRLYDVTGLDLSYQTPHSVQQFDCGELSRDQDIPVSESDRDYIAEIGYLTADQRWLRMARSATVRVPSVEGF